MATAAAFFAAFLIAAFVGLYLSLRREIKLANEATLGKLHDMHLKGPGVKGEPCPSGAAEVVSPAPAPAGLAPPAVPVPALPAVERRAVAVESAPASPLPATRRTPAPPPGAAVRTSD